MSSYVTVYLRSRYAVKEQLFRIKRSVAPAYVAFESGIVYKYLSPKKDLRKR